MTWLRLATIVAGLGAGVLGVLVPATAPFAIGTAGLLLGLAGPTIGAPKPQEPPKG